MSDDLFDVFVEEAEAEQVTAYTLPTKVTSPKKAENKEIGEDDQQRGIKRENDDDIDDGNDRKRFEQEDFDDWR